MGSANEVVDDSQLAKSFSAGLACRLSSSDDKNSQKEKTDIQNTYPLAKHYPR